MDSPQVPLPTHTNEKASVADHPRCSGYGIVDIGQKANGEGDLKNYINFTEFILLI